MVKTKTTPAKCSQEAHRCPVRGDRFSTSKECGDHIVNCCKEKRVSTCFVGKDPACICAAHLERNIKRHNKRKYQKSAIDVPENDSDSEEI